MADFLLSIWTYFATNILTQPAYLIGFIVLLGYILLKRPFYECIAGFLKQQSVTSF
ncbi:PTS system ascorbate-specific transporter subunit IIC [Enterococcus sp. DIV1089c]